MIYRRHRDPSRSPREFFDFVTELSKPVARLAREDINAGTAGHPAYRVVKEIWFAAVFAARGRKAAIKIFRINKDRRALAGINNKFAVILWQSDRLKTAGLVPNHSQNVIEAETIDKPHGRRPMLLRGPHEQMAIWFEPVWHFVAPEFLDFVFRHCGIVERVLIGPHVAVDLLHLPWRVDYNHAERSIFRERGNRYGMYFVALDFRSNRREYRCRRYRLSIGSNSLGNLGQLFSPRGPFLVDTLFGKGARTVYWFRFGTGRLIWLSARRLRLFRQLFRQLSFGVDPNKTGPIGHFRDTLENALPTPRSASDYVEIDERVRVLYFIVQTGENFQRVRNRRKTLAWNYRDALVRRIVRHASRLFGR